VPGWAVVLGRRGGLVELCASGKHGLGGRGECRREVSSGFFDLGERVGGGSDVVASRHSSPSARSRWGSLIAGATLEAVGARACVLALAGWMVLLRLPPQRVRQ
jgi:hypothetical protein